MSYNFCLNKSTVRVKLNLYLLTRQPYIKFQFSKFKKKNQRVENSRKLQLTQSTENLKTLLWPFHSLTSYGMDKNCHYEAFMQRLAFLTMCFLRKHPNSLF